MKESVRLSEQIGWELPDSYNLIGKKFQEMYERTPEQYWEDCLREGHRLPPVSHPDEIRKCFLWWMLDAEYYESVNVRFPQEQKISNDNEYDHDR